MAVVIRLQGLRITAGSEDIRNFFTGLTIPDGGVHIIGGELEEAFIIFASDEDARRAMTRSGGCIKGSPVNLLLSSKSEMQKILEESTRNSEANNRGFYKEGLKRQPPDGASQPLNKDMRVDMRRDQHIGNRTAPVSRNSFQYQTGDVAVDEDSPYLNLSGMPFAATKDDVRLFFDGLQVEDMIFMRNNRGMFNGCAFVKFINRQDAREGLKRDRQYMGKRYIRVTRCSQDQWVNAGGLVRPEGPSQRNQALFRSRSRSPVQYRSRSHSPSKEEYCVLYENLLQSVEKRDIKELLYPVSVNDDQIIIFNENNREGTKSAVVVFRNLKDYCSGLAHHKETFLHRLVCVSPISKEKMVALLESSDESKDDGRRSSRSSERSQKSVHDSEKRCLYVRNLPFDVRKVEIIDFFHGFQLSEDRVILLHDERGSGLGEALVIFQTEREAVMAQSLNGQRFLGSEVMLKCITWAQVQEFGVNIELPSNMPERSFRNNGATYSEPSHFSDDRTYQDQKISRPNVQRYDHGNAVFQNFDDYGPHEPHVSPAQRYEPPEEQFDGPTCLKLVNLPSLIRTDEIYDFCYGYRVIPGSVSLQYDRNGLPMRSATVVFENHSEAVTAVQELNGRPIGTRKIKVMFV